MTAALAPIFAFARLTLRLNLRNAMALIYGYAFPLVFLAAFAIIYRHDPAPLIGHLGELLTVTALGGACFGLPTTLVAERERGVWRRYRATPAGPLPFVLGLVLSRLALLVSAALIQLALAGAALGMPLPADPLGLAFAYLLVCLALIGLGMIVAMLAGSVPAVQALGQCIFLPMLMIGGVAVRLSSLPEWTQRLSAFFPGRFAVAGPRPAALAALAAFALASGLIAASLFRWDRSRPRAHRPLLALGLALWLATGLAGLASGIGERAKIVDMAPVAARQAFLRAAPATVAPPKAAPTARPMAPPPARARAAPKDWRGVTQADIDGIAFERLPDDMGLVAPIAPRGTLDDEATAGKIAEIRAALASWPPGAVADPVQRVRNLLMIPAVPDLLQIDPLERHLPWLVFDRMRQQLPPGDLARILYWIARHPDQGDDSAIAGIDALGLPAISGPTDRLRERIMIYALKCLARLEAARRAAQPAP
jgi:ABC-2 type transport system permease protein